MVALDNLATPLSELARLPPANRARSPTPETTCQPKCGLPQPATPARALRLTLNADTWLDLTEG